jgi:hypothetical protein
MKPSCFAAQEIHKRMPFETANGVSAIAKTTRSTTSALKRNKRFFDGIG